MSSGGVLTLRYMLLSNYRRLLTVPARFRTHAPRRQRIRQATGLGLAPKMKCGTQREALYHISLCGYQAGNGATGCHAGGCVVGIAQVGVVC
jgi:hypothetical protein